MPVVFCLMFLQTAFAQAPDPSDSLKNVLIAKEAEMFRVVLNGDKPAAEKMFATDYMTINADGTMQDKTETMKLFGKFKGATTTLSDKRIRTYGNLSIITGGAKFYIKSILVAQIFYTETWIFRNGQWDFIGWQGTDRALQGDGPGVRRVRDVIQRTSCSARKSTSRVAALPDGFLTHRGGR